MFPMKAMKDFRGREGEGKNRMVEAGVEFTVASKGRANDLEVRGLAVPVKRVSDKKPEVETAVSPVQNEASETGPLGSLGGETGAAAKPPLFSRRGRQRAERT